MNNFLLRRITIDDVSALSAIAKKTFFDAFSGTCTPADMSHFLDLYYTENTLAKEIADTEMQYYFAEVNGQIAGYILYKENNLNFAETKSKKTIELKRLYVLGNYHGKKIAQKMMAHFLDYAAKNNFEMAFLGVWEYNCRARYFYSKFGFLPTKYRHNFPIGNTPQTDLYLIKDLLVM
ncbi:MAG: GNAT family N-acetyltransferase [Ferruginibacter sp.]|nr:GNAT family N-acetyltransferase [Ferruginibacter sp.]